MTKKIASLLLASVLLIGFNACKDDDEGVDPPNTNEDPKTYLATINMKQLANNIAVTYMTGSTKPYTNKKGQSFNISRLRYLISDVTFIKSDGTSFMIDDYHFVDLSDDASLTYTPSTKVPAGTYSSITFKFGFDEQDNDSVYADLNTTNWNWPAMLGGGYHNMQLEGMYDSLGNDRFFATHMGTARDMGTTPPTFENNHFVAQPANSGITVGSDFEFDITMNVEQWYEDTFEWDFTVYNAPIMPDYAAQKRLNENGPTVFTVTIP